MVCDDFLGQALREQILAQISLAGLEDGLEEWRGEGSFRSIDTRRASVPVALHRTLLEFFSSSTWGAEGQVVPVHHHLSEGVQ